MVLPGVVAQGPSTVYGRRYISCITLNIEKITFTVSYSIRIAFKEFAHIGALYFLQYDIRTPPLLCVQDYLSTSCPNHTGNPAVS